MSMNEAPRGVRLHIGFFGCRNAGKSSLVNALSGQQMSVVSEVPGTTTDPVSKSMEILPAGPVVIIDTPGYDDEGALGELRVRRTKESLARCDLAVLAVDALKGLMDADRELLSLFREQDTPGILVWTKADLMTEKEKERLLEQKASMPCALVSAATSENIAQLREMIGQAAGQKARLLEKPIVSDLVSPLDLVVLVIPIDASAPKGRLILPQQQVLRDLLDHGALALCVRENELEDALSSMERDPTLVITDSQAFGHVSKVVKDKVPLTSFSILMARYKGVLAPQLRGVRAIRDIQDNDRILIAEGCTHHRQCGDIGTVKLPRWICEFTGKNPVFETSSGLSFPEDLEKYKVIIHCGSCMLNEKEVRMRNARAAACGIPITNYGMAIALTHGILDRALGPIPEAHMEE